MLDGNGHDAVPAVRVELVVGRTVQEVGTAGEHDVPPRKLTRQEPAQAKVAYAVGASARHGGSRTSSANAS
jgi:hypothetical protein